MEKKNIIGVFDSGIGGLSILRELIKEMPQENFFYIADIAHAPYGEKNQEYILDRIEKISSYLINHEQFKLKTLVVACNTATAYTIDFLRKKHPNISIIGVEPAIKTASEFSKTKKVGVLATYGTIHSQRFKELIKKQNSSVEFVLQPCNELSKSIDMGNISFAKELCYKYINSLGTLGHNKEQIDSIVLGCTHYPLISEIIQEIAGENIKLFDTSLPVTKQTKKTTNLEFFQNVGNLYLASTKNPEILTKASEKFLSIKQESILIDI